MEAISHYVAKLFNISQIFSPKIVCKKRPNYLGCKYSL